MGLVDAGRAGIQHNSVRRASVFRGNLLVAHVRQDRLGVALERIAPAAGTGQLVQQLVTTGHVECGLGWQHLLVRTGIEDVARPPAGSSARQAVRGKAAAVGADLKRA